MDEQTPEPTVGRIVHYSQGGNWHQAQHEAAIVTEADGTAVNVAVFDRAANFRPERFVSFDATADQAHTWHWPER